MTNRMEEMRFILVIALLLSVGSLATAQQKIVEVKHNAAAIVQAESLINTSEKSEPRKGIK